MGGIQLVGSFKWEMMKGEAPPLTPPIVLQTMKSHSVPWWLTTEDLPSHDNRVRWIAGKGIQLDYTPNNEKALSAPDPAMGTGVKGSGRRPHLCPGGVLPQEIHSPGRRRAPERHLPFRIRIRRPRCWISTAARTTSTISMSWTVPSFLPAARSIPRSRSSPTRCAWAITCCNVSGKNARWRNAAKSSPSMPPVWFKGVGLVTFPAASAVFTSLRSLRPNEHGIRRHVCAAGHHGHCRVAPGRGSAKPPRAPSEFISSDCWPISCP